MLRFVALVFVLLTAACTAQPAPPPAPVAAAPTSTGESPVLRLPRLVPAEAAMAKAGFRKRFDYNEIIEAENYQHALIRSCERSRSDQRISHAGRQDWEVPAEYPHHLVLEQSFNHYRDGKASEAIAEVRQQLTCGRFTHGHSTFRNTEELSLPTPPGIEAQYAACGSDRGRRFGCLLVVAKGEHAVGSLVEGIDEAKLKAALRGAAPVIAEALAKA